MSGNYHSRVFTFINKRSNELKDSCAKGLRHLKIAVVWSGQILLYPLHLLAQTAKIFQPQLSPPPPQRTLPSQPEPDLNIEQALDLVAGAGYPIAIATSAALSIEDRSSIDLQPWNVAQHHPAIANDNSIEDWEIDSSPPSSRQATQTKPIVRGLSSLLVDRQLVLVTTENHLLDLLTPAQQQELRRRIGIDLAITWQQWQTHELPHDEDRQLLSAGGATERSHLNGKNFPQLTATMRSPKLSQRWHDWLKNLTTTPSDNLMPPIETTMTRVESASVRQLPPTSYPFTPQPPHISRVLDLPQLPPINELPTTSQTNSIQKTISKLQPDWLKQWLNYYRDYLHIPAPADRQIVHQPAEFQLVPLVKPTEITIDSNSKKIRFRPTPAHQNFDESSSKLTHQQARDLEHHPDWIEAQSETIGYKTSLIAKILRWLDRVMLKVENWVIKIWHIVTNKPLKY
jgi:hypothetical protein